MVIDYLKKRIDASPIDDAMRDFVKEVRAEYGDEVAMQELRLLESFGDVFQVEYDDFA